MNPGGVIILFVTYLSLLGFPVKAQYDGKLGINLGNIHPDFFTDMVRSTRPWLKGNQPLPTIDLDEKGWPKTDFDIVLMDPRPVAEWAAQIDDPEVYRIDRGGTYSGSFYGMAQIRNGGGDWSIANQTYDPPSNLTTFELLVGPPGPNHGLVVMNFVNTRRSDTSDVGTGLTELQILKPGYDSNKPYTDYFFETLTSANFSAIRSQNFTGTTSWTITFPQEYRWEDRKPADYAIQSGPIANYHESAAWEHYINLCNRARMDIWVNIPISASEDYVTSLASLLQETLDEDLNIYIENDNEVWNSAEAFIGTWNYNDAEAKALGISFEENIARRAVELSNLFESVFGEEEINNRIRVILASHSPMLKWWVEPMLDYVNNNYGPPKNFIYGLSRQLYFRSDQNASESSQSEILSQYFEDIDSQLEGESTNQAGRLDWVREAQEWGLNGGATSYEGGPHTPCCGNVSNLDNEIATHRHPTIKKVLQYNLANNWFDLGGGLAMHFTLFSGYNRYGAWGLTDDLSNPDRNSKFDALRNLEPIVVGLDRHEEPIESVWPNPTQDFLWITTNTKVPIEIQLMDIFGKVVLRARYDTASPKVQLPTLANGLYYLRISDGFKVNAHKIVIRR